MVEIGLNYPIEHLEKDDGKLDNNDYTSSDKKEAAYLVHLWQPHKGIKNVNEEFKRLERFASKTKMEVEIAVFIDS